MSNPLHENLLDRAISYMAPVYGLKRYKARMQASIGGYVGASLVRRSLKGWTRRTLDADSALSSDRETLIASCQDLYRNNALAAGLINTNVTHIVGSGYTLQSRIDRDLLGMTDDEADAWEARAEREWKLFSESVECDQLRQRPFNELADLSLRSELLGGDVFTVLPSILRMGSPYRLKIQVIEGARVSNPDGGQNTDTLTPPHDRRVISPGLSSS